MENWAICLGVRTVRKFPKVMMGEKRTWFFHTLFLIRSRRQEVKVEYLRLMCPSYLQC
jgi:hypothetical protein